MPIWCLNDLRVSGNSGDCAEFRTLARGIPPRFADDSWPYPEPPLELSLHALVPVPAEVLAAGYRAGGSVWQRTHWGTEGDLRDDLRVDDFPDGGIAYAFETVSSPPRPWFVQVAAAFPWLRFEFVYLYPPVPFCGRLRAQHGRVIECWECTDYSEWLVSFAVEQFGSDWNEGIEDVPAEWRPPDDAI